MKKIFYLVVFVFLVNEALAVEGVSPGSYRVDFEPGMEKEFVFDFVVVGNEVLRVDGDLAEYVKLDKVDIWDRERVVAKLKLPEKIDKVGVSNVRVLAGGVVGVIVVNFSYPKKYVGLELSAPNINVGEDIDVKLKISNLGQEDVIVNSVIEVYSDGQIFESFDLGINNVSVSESLDFGVVLNGENYSAGDYLVVARCDYGDGVSSLENVFRVGKFDLKILNYTKEVHGKIERFEVEVENLWNDRMKKVFVEVRVIGMQDESGEVSLNRDTGFDSSIIGLEAWEKKDLVGFFDSSDLSGEVMLSLDVHYDNEVKSKVVRVKVAKEFGWWIWGGFFLFFWLLWLVLFFRRRLFSRDLAKGLK